MGHVIAQISDLHLSTRKRWTGGRVDPEPYLLAAIDHLNLLKPELVLITGDLVARGKEEEYDKLVELLAGLCCPVRVIAGNHDRREPMRERFSDHLPGDGEFLHYAFEHCGLRFIALDTTTPGQTAGVMCQQRLDFLRQELKVKCPTVIVMHHPPVAIGIPRMDRIGCNNADRVGQVVAEHPWVELVVCGHVHRPAMQRWCGSMVFTCPAIANQLSLSLGVEGDAIWVHEPAAVAIHFWQPGQGVITHLSYIGMSQPVLEAPDYPRATRLKG